MAVDVYKLAKVVVASPGSLHLRYQCIVSQLYPDSSSYASNVHGANILVITGDHVGESPRVAKTSQLKARLLSYNQQEMFGVKIIFITLLTMALFCYIRLWIWHAIPREQVAPPKYVGFSLNWGRMGNQLFHLVTGYGIARTLGRVHYLPKSGPLDHVKRYLKVFDKVFPALRESYVLMPNGSVEARVPFVGSCCGYEDPRRYLNHSATYLHLNFIYGQNPRFFEPYLDDVRRLLKFSEIFAKEGDYQIKTLEAPLNSMMCIHIRRGDFVNIKVETNVNETIRAVNNISEEMRTSRFMIFGDDQGFMRNLSHLIASSRNISENAVLISNFSDTMDLYLSSRLCNSFLITAVTSTFGWWLAFFIENQNAVYYLLDNRRQADKVPSKELFLKPWHPI
ncbi:hypothetical protein Q1695_004062 [Nippostrongylus brasiliensis]|nr:hypothetical protein Q1695_004062 [Nippostrongylus brasiliensis]